MKNNNTCNNNSFIRLSQCFIQCPIPSFHGTTHTQIVTCVTWQTGVLGTKQAQLWHARCSLLTQAAVVNTEGVRDSDWIEHRKNYVKPQAALTSKQCPIHRISSTYTSTSSYTTSYNTTVPRAKEGSFSYYSPHRKFTKKEWRNTAYIFKWV